MYAEYRYINTCVTSLHNVCAERKYIHKLTRILSEDSPHNSHATNSHHSCSVLIAISFSSACEHSSSEHAFSRSRTGLS